ncbi:MAG: hypothetical protein KJN62_05910, partial [Deltaproteobacteria bacterium]|nr:hypothetical protein [Deltaproteobacteria bacterium]
MRTKPRNFLYLLVLFIFMTSALVGHTDDRARDRASLRGIKTIKVCLCDSSQLASAGLVAAKSLSNDPRHHLANRIGGNETAGAHT